MSDDNVILFPGLEISPVKQLERAITYNPTSVVIIFETESEDSRLLWFASGTDGAGVNWMLDQVKIDVLAGKTGDPDEMDGGED